MPGKNRNPALRLRITLEGTEPPFWRSVIFPRNATLQELHRAIQVLFDWYDYHLYQFEIDDRVFEASDEEAEGEGSSRIPRRGRPRLREVGRRWTEAGGATTRHSSSRSQLQSEVHVSAETCFVSPPSTQPPSSA